MIALMTRAVTASVLLAAACFVWFGSDPDAELCGSENELVDARLLAMNVAAADEKPVVQKPGVSKSLSEDGRIGKITDTQGLITLRPVLHQRWTPVCRQTLLKPGDWVRTDLRGPNAVLLSLTSEVQVTLGPGTLVECVSFDRVKVHGGEVQVVLPEKLEREFVVAGPGGRGGDGETEVKFQISHSKSQGPKPDAQDPKRQTRRHLFRVTRDEKLVALKSPPAWLTGFEGTTVGEKIGTLIANVDGRNEPLTVGYHKVSVEIRDQIARTTIEESFVNRTKGRLEGVFHFPLPSDASISGFGMWIGNQLVEADVVEKQRAREIYETILRERRDPGLLEWTAGNIFKARVFPIEPFSEKRIKIVYTQVLPLRGNRYRYSYGLQSDLLRQFPVRELAIDVTVNSALPLKSVECVTHDVRQDGKTAAASGRMNSAKLSFAAQEYVPTRDFEVVCEIDGRQNDVVVIPHRRGDDGYLMLQLSPPAPEGNWQREILPDGQPLDVLLLCDTSGSMDEDSRRKQAEFVGSLLSSLGEKDTFNLAGCDVACVWAFEKSVPATAANVELARKLLSDRGSLGWTDLDRTFASVLERVGNGSQVVYIGDGVVTARDADPQGFVNRLDRLYGDQKHGTFHAVSVSSTFESVVLKAIARLGGGSVRAISGEQTPQAVAVELLNEIAQPGLRDLQLEFRGMQVAAVYPSKLPNVAAGMQQVVLARYLPERGARDEGRGASEVIVTGKRGTETVRYAAKVSFKEDEAGNSFIPRLWARMHLDQLLSQGRSDFIKDEIIRLSEEFHIITPYTSLLVLETDADRERFGVTRHYLMRDGERYFAEGRDNAQFELLQKHMQHAGDWRLGLRRSILKELSGLGRESAEQIAQQRQRSLGRLSGWAGGYGGGGAFGGEEFGRDMIDLSSSLAFDAGEMNASGPMGFAQPQDRLSDSDEFSAGEKSDSRAVKDDLADGKKLADRDADELLVSDREELQQANQPMSGPMAASALRAESDSFFDTDFEMSTRGGLSLGGSLFKSKANKGGSYRYGGAFGGRGRRAADITHSIQWMNSVFPALALPPSRLKSPQQPTPNWSADALELSKSLLRTESLQLLADGRGVEIRRVTKNFDPRWKRDLGQTEAIELYAPLTWLTRPSGVGEHVVVNWCDDKQRGVFSRAFDLGRVRKSEKAELQTPPLALSDFSIVPLHAQTYWLKATVEPLAADSVRLKLAAGENSEQHYSINPQKHVLLKAEFFESGKLARSMHFSDFVEVAGRQWATKVTTLDGEGRVTKTETQTVTLLDAQPYRERVASELAARPAVAFLNLPLPSVTKAKQAIAEGKPSFEDRFVVLLHFSMSQQWAKVFEQLDAIEKGLLKGNLGETQQGVLRSLILKSAGRNEEARQRLLAGARTIVGRDDPQDLFVAGFLLAETYGISDWNEYLKLIELLKPVFDRQPETLGAKGNWQRKRLDALRILQRFDELNVGMLSLLKTAEWDVSLHTQRAQDLANAGEFDAAFDWLKQHSNRAEWLDYERDSFRDAQADLLRRRSRYAGLATFLAENLERRPATSEQPYARFLSTLILADQEDAAHKLMRQWISEAKVPGKLSPTQLARLNGALNLAFGQAPEIWIGRIDERWMPELTGLARFFMKHPIHHNVTNNILAHHPFGESDEVRQLRAEWLPYLKAEMETLKVEQIAMLVGSLLGNDPEISDTDWNSIVTALRGRWLKMQGDEKRIDERHALGGTIASIFQNRFPSTAYLPFLREQVQVGPEIHRTGYRQQLFNALLAHAWSDEREAETLALLSQLGSADNGSERDEIQVEALIRFVDRMLVSRHAAAMQGLNATEHPETLTRTLYAQKVAEFRLAAKDALIARLNAAAKTRGVGILPANPPEKRQAGSLPHDALAQWLTIERGFLEVGLGRNLDSVSEECWAVVGHLFDAPAPQQDADAFGLPLNEDEHDEVVLPLEAALRERAFATLMNLACRRSASAESVARLIKFVDQGIAQPGDESARWKQTKFRLLVALDRPDELARELSVWIKADAATSSWRLALARLQAERGQIKDAITLFESVERDNELGASDFAVLANWYLASNRRADYERAKIAVWKVAEEYRIQQFLYSVTNRWQRADQPLPSTLDENVLFALQALFAKSNSPGSYLYQVRQLYEACRDFRLLQMLPDAVVGKSTQQIYSVLGSLSTTVLVELREEATADEILKRIRELRESGKPGIAKLTAGDLRALDLFEALIERQSSEVLNQPGPHVEASVAALRRAFDRVWAEGEQRQMADWLASLGNITQPKLADEQIRELTVLAERQKPGSDDRLFITAALARVHAGAGRHERAIALMEVAVREFEQTHPDGWPAHANPPLSGFIGLLEGAKRYAVAEAAVRKHIVHPVNATQLEWLKLRVTQTYRAALQNDGEVSLGSGETLFLNLVKHVLKEVEPALQSQRLAMFNELIEVFRIAHHKKLPSTNPELKKFAFEQLPVLLKTQVDQYEHFISHTERAVTEILGVRDGLAFFIERIEQYPRRLLYSWNSPWQQFGYRVAHLRFELKQLGDLEPRLLKLVLAELRRELRARDHRGGQMYHRGNQYFWDEKTADFAQVAEEVLAERPNSGRNALYVANYLFHLDRKERAVEMLFAAHKRGLLRDEGVQTLVGYLHSMNRYGETIALLEPLVEKRPDTVYFRHLLMRAYYETKRPEQLLALLKATDEHFRSGGRWTEDVAAQLARTCNETALSPQSIAYYDEAIALHRRLSPHRGFNDAVLSSYFHEQAYAYSRLQKTREAVEAASAAIVLWSPRHAQRQSAINALAHVLNAANDRDAYVKWLDEQVVQDNQERPLIRKYLGRAYQSHKEHAKAVAQLKLAIEVTPQDKELHQWLIVSYDALGLTDAATAQLLALMNWNRRDLELYKQLATRLASNEAEAERAATMLVEALPTETESHTALAELRQQQDRWDDAIIHWKKVAELRSLEPTGLLRLADAQLHQKQWPGLDDSLDRLSATKWPARFSDVRHKTDDLRARSRAARPESK